MATDILFLPAVLFLGIVSTIQDFRVRRISNLWIIISLAYAAGAHLYLFMSGDQQETLWSLRAFVNILASALVAIYFWKQNWWGGGDAKLFVCYSALIPLSHYPFGYFSYYFASFLLLLVTFIPAAIWTFLYAQIGLIKARRNIYNNFSLSKERFWEFIQLSVCFVAIFFLSKLLALILGRYFYGIKDLSVIVWLFSLGFYKIVFKLLQKWLWLLAVLWILGMCSMVFVPCLNQINVWRVVFNSFLSWMFIFILRRHVFRTIENYVEWTKNNNMAFAEWMFLGAVVVWFSKGFCLLKWN